MAGHSLRLTAVDRRFRNTLFETIQEVGLDGCDLDYTTISAETKRRWYVPLLVGDSVVIRHPLTGSRFSISTSGNAYSVSYSVTDGPKLSFDLVADLEGGVQQLRRWAEQTKYVADNPDLWKQARQAAGVLTQAPDDNTPFTPEESDEVSRRLDEALEQMRKRFDLSNEQMTAIAAGVEEIKKATTRMGRKDWLVFLSGTAFNLILADEVPPHAMQTLFDLAVRGIAHLFGVGSPPPIISA